jgi:ABC-type transport system involved in multi-copper enzyme maturation permease subunit
VSTPLPPPLPLAKAARAVFDLTVEGMVWSRRSTFMAVLLGLPAVFAVVYRIVLAAKMPPEISAYEMYGMIVAVYYVGNVLPLAALFYGSALVAEEVDGRTITYLFSRPIRRSAILAGKFAAYLATTFALALPSVMVTFFLLATARGVRGISGNVPDLFRDLGVVALTLVVYGAFFTLMGVALRRPVIPGLMFLFGWELLARLPGDFPKYTITAWLRSLITHRPAEEGLAGMFGQVFPAALSLEVLGGMIILFLGTALWIFGAREYVLEQ